MTKAIGRSALSAALAALLSLGTISMPAAANGCLGFEEAGTSGDPKLVESVTDLALLGTIQCLSSSYYFEQTEDIYLSDPWTPYAFDFTANYDGGGYAIGNLQVEVAGNAGFFSTISAGQVSNMRFVNASVVSTGSYAGVLAGEVKNASTVSRISVGASLVKGFFATGGLVGMTSGARSTISEVSVVATVESIDNIGGVLGQGESNSATITDISFSGSVTGTGNYAAGIVGYGLGTIVEKVYSTGTITGGAAARGGIVGTGYSGTVVRKSFYLIGTVDSNSNVGGDATPGEQMTSRPLYFSNDWSIGDSVDVLRSGSATETWFIDPEVGDGYPVLVWAYEAGEFACDPGKLSVNGQQPCVAAPAGTFVAVSGSTEATLCPIGFYNPNEGSMVCYTADEGHFVGSEGQSAQVECPVGEYQPLTAQSACLLAPEGTFVNSTGQTAPVNCPAGEFQDQTGQITCIDAEPGFYVAIEGASAQVQCDPGTTSQAGAIACYPIPVAAGYTGPVLQVTNIVAAPGPQVVIAGSNLDQVTSVSIAGLTATATCTKASCSFVLPAGLGAGTFDLVLVGSHGALSIANAITVTDPLVTNTEVRAWTKRISDTEVKVYAKDIVGSGKVQFMLGGKEIAWVNAVDETDTKLSFANGFSYLVRTVDLAPGKNRFEILVDGERVFRATYVPKG